MAASLMEQVKAANEVLTALKLGDSAAWTRVSGSQKDLIILGLQKGNWPMVDLAPLATLVRMSAFTSEDQTGMFAAMARLKACNGELPVPPNSSVNMQDWETIVGFVPENVWNAEGTGSFGMMLMEFILAMGLRNPTAGTSQVLSLLTLVGGEGVPKVAAMSPEARLHATRSWKKWMKRAADKKAKPEPWVAVLPLSPQDLQVQYPDLHASVFAASRAAPERIDPAKFEILRANTPMRAPKGSAKCSRAGPTIVAGGGVQQMMQNMVQQAVQQMAHQMFGMQQGLQDNGIPLQFPPPRGHKSRARGEQLRA